MVSTSSWSWCWSWRSRWQVEEEGKGLKEGLKGERVSTSGKFPRRKNTRPPPTLLRLQPLQCKFHTALLRVSTQLHTNANKCTRYAQHTDPLPVLMCRGDSVIGWVKSSRARWRRPSKVNSRSCLLCVEAKFALRPPELWFELKFLEPKQTIGGLSLSSERSSDPKRSASNNKKMVQYYLIFYDRALSDPNDLYWL